MLATVVALLALHYALAFASQFGAEVTLVHIVEQMVYPGDWMYPPLAVTDFASEKREQMIDRLRSLDAGSGVKTNHVVRLGRAWQEVVEIARRDPQLRLNWTLAPDFGWLTV